ncbi:aldehyde dehydrogenase family 16 member A1-like [Oncorhynchus tshawytscha]|uniref:aldehyde dehydrogenase family 16 member A1-like n=1 Tax=Oncorhynchus tshawytscha TaxID=74940 RepID=UPI001C3CB01C|nr:aldehyde dehydrogenase family 16 member A1-like [Oncorhynchus tshawytscha]
MESLFAVQTDMQCGTVYSAVDEDVSSGASGFKAWNALPCHLRAKTLLRSSTEDAGSPRVSIHEVIGDPYQGAVSVLCCVALILYWKGSKVMSGQMALKLARHSMFKKLTQKWQVGDGPVVLEVVRPGNTVVAIPGVGTVPPVLLLAQLFVEAGLPAGVLNVVTGNILSLGSKVAQNPHVSYVTYSGNKKDGEILCRATAGMGVPVSLSLTLGATCPFIFESADIDSAVDGVIETAFKKTRECQWMLCVQESVWDSVVARLKVRMAGMKSVPLLAEGDRRLVDAAVQEAQQQGATLIQPCPPPSSSTAYPPTVLCGVACVVTPFPGPLLPLSFRSHGEGVTLGNHSPHGQAASLWTEDPTLALEAAKSMSVGQLPLCYGPFPASLWPQGEWQLHRWRERGSVPVSPTFLLDFYQPNVTDSVGKVIWYWGSMEVCLTPV